MTVTELEEYLGLEGTQAICNWERGRNMPKLENLIAWCHRMDVKMEDVLVYVGEEDKTEAPLPKGWEGLSTMSFCCYTI